MRVAVRVDASLPMGSGHVMRCLALADALKGRRADVVFVSRLHDGHLCDLVERRGFEVRRLPAPRGAPAGQGGHAAWLGAPLEREIVEAREAVRAMAPVEWLVVDHYALDRRWEVALAGYVAHVLVIDDLADRPHAADVLLDQNVPADPARYAGLVGPGTLLLLGPRHALLREDYAVRRPAAPRAGATVRRVLVFLGGVDERGASNRVLSALDEVGGPGLEVDLVVGAGCPHVEALKAACRGRSGRRLHVQTDAMPDLLAAADLAVGGGGTATWERACLGVPSIVLSLAENQEPIARRLGEQGAQIYLGREADVTDASLRAALALLLANAPLRSTLAQASFPLTDGRGAERVALRLVPPRVALRAATEADCDAVFAWRNHPDTRRHFFDAAPLDLTTHRAWFARALADRSRDLLIGAVDGVERGVLRYDVAGTRAVVSIYLDPAQRGHGHGTALLRAGADWLREHRPTVRTVTAEVLPGNEASLRAFQAAGYRERHRTLTLDLGEERP